MSSPAKDVATGEVDTGMVEFVRLGNTASVNFTVRVPNRATLDAILAAANPFPDRVASTIGPVLDGTDSVELGREGCAVLYLTVPYWTHQRFSASTHTNPGLYADSQRHATEERRAYTQSVIDWARQMGADKIHVQQNPYALVEGEPGENPYRIRVMWE